MKQGPEAPGKIAGPDNKERITTMKLRNLLLAAALFLTATITFASSNVSDLLSLSYSADTNTLNLMMFRMNMGWSYSIIGYTQGANGLVKAYESELSKKTETVATNDDPEKLNAFIDSLNISDSQIVASLKEHTIRAYIFTVPVPEDIVKLEIEGGSGNGNTTIFDRTATNGNQFMVLDNVIYFGKENWVGDYQNGAMFLAGDTQTFGAPLPTPVVTLLIALGLGAALVMYRNRKQVKA
jgi:hypothetical protein